MKKPLFSTLAAIALTAPLPVKADYGYSKFGMTPDQVVAASGGTATLVPARVGEEVFKLSLRVQGTVKTGERLNFYFSKADERLMLVKLIPRSDACEGLDTDFAKIWGKPLIAESTQLAPSLRTGMTRWRVASGDLVSLAQFRSDGQPDSCHLLFQPPGTTF